MSVPHPPNLAWTHKLLWIVSLSRGQLIEAAPNQSVQYLIYQQIDPSIGAQSPSNRHFKQAVSPKQPFRVPLLSTGGIVCIAVDMTEKYSDFDLTLYSNQNVKGTLTISMGYQVQNPHEVAQRADVLTDLWRYCQDAVQRIVSPRSHLEISIDPIREALRRVNAQSIGLSVVNVVLPHPIFWDQSVSRVDTTIAAEQARAAQSRNVMRMQLETDNERRRLIAQELRPYGLDDIETISEVIAALDLDKGYSATQSISLSLAIKKVLDDRRQRREQQIAEHRKLLDELHKDGKLQRYNYDDMSDIAIRGLNQGYQDQQQESRPNLAPRRPTPSDPHINSSATPYVEPPYLSSGNTPHVIPIPPITYGTDSPLSQNVAPETYRKLVDYGGIPSQSAPASLFDLTHRTGTFMLNYPVTYLGRRIQDNHIVISDDRVSRQHCIIEFYGESVYIRNHEQMQNPIDTLVNGHKVGTQRVALQDGDEIMIGEARLLFRLQRQAGSSGGWSQDQRPR